MFYDALNEDEKQQIARLYHEKKLSIDEICEELGVCKKTAYNHRDYGYENIEKSMMPTQTKDQISKKRQWLCKTPGCGFITDRKNVLCPKCQKGPFFSQFVEIGTPDHERFIKETESQENEEPCDWTKDYSVCRSCDYASNKEFKICPKCKSRDVEFAPNGREPRDQSKYKDPEPQENNNSEFQDNEEPGDDNETNTTTGEEQTQENEYECPKCRKEFNGVLENCPHCGISLMDARECPRCHHEWYGSPDRCPKCGAELQE